MTEEFVLQVELLSDGAPGTGEGRASSIDHEVPHDDFGLPILPGRRLKGLLREAVLELEDCDLVRTGTALELFGQSTRPGLVRVGSAELVEAAELRPWIAWWRAIAPMDFGVEQVLASFTYFRQQTAMDRSTGAPKDGTLRRIRVLRRGLSLRATVTLDSEKADLTSALALGAGAMRRLGVARNRGFGHMGCVLLQDGTNQTEREIEHLQQ